MQLYTNIISKAIYIDDLELSDNEKKKKIIEYVESLYIDEKDEEENDI